MHRGSRRLLFDRLRRRCFRLFRESGLFCFSEYKFRFFRRIRRILRRADENVRHTCKLFRVVPANRNYDKIPGLQRDAAGQIGIACAVFFELHFAELIISAARRSLRRCFFFVIFCPRLRFFLRFLVLVVFLRFFRFSRQADRCPVWLDLLGKINFRCAVIAEIVIETVCVVQQLSQVGIFSDTPLPRQLIQKPFPERAKAGFRDHPIFFKQELLRAQCLIDALAQRRIETLPEGAQKIAHALIDLLHLHGRGNYIQSKLHRADILILALTLQML